MICRWAGSVRRPSVRSELAALQTHQGLSLVSYYEDMELVLFKDQSASHFSLPPTSGYSLYGVLSPDATLVVRTVREVQSKRFVLTSSRLDSTDLRRYPEIGYPVSMCLSNDGSTMALSVQSVQHNPPDNILITLNLNSKATKQVDVRADVSTQCWSPDGNHFVYEADNSVRVYDLENGNVHILARGRHPTWSPDGRWIAFLDEDVFYQWSPDGRDRRALFRAKEADSALWWSPDGRIVAYASRTSFLEGRWMFLEETYRLRARRLEDNSEDWVADLGGMAHNNFQWVTSPALLQHAKPSD
jgi:hypothetical protein